MRISDWSSDVCSSDLTAFTEYKLTRGMLDYDDILIYFAALLEDETIGKLIRQRWSHVMVDEYQDTNAIQLEIVYGLAGKQENLFIVTFGRAPGREGVGPNGWISGAAVT